MAFAMFTPSSIAFVAEVNPTMKAARFREGVASLIRADKLGRGVKNVSSVNASTAYEDL